MPKHIEIKQSGDFFSSDGLYVVEIKTPLLLTHREIREMGDFSRRGRV